MYFKRNIERGILVSPEDESLIRLHSWNVTEGRAQTVIDGKPVRLHQLILPDVEKVDHRNRNQLDNRRENLRPASTSQNMQNSKVRADSVTGYRGVSWSNRLKKYRCRIHVNGKDIHLGLFSTPIAAAKEYNKAALKYFGEFACLNIIQEGN